jgi:hypothetical protein
LPPGLETLAEIIERLRGHMPMYVTDLFALLYESDDEQDDETKLTQESAEVLAPANSQESVDEEVELSDRELLMAMGLKFGGGAREFFADFEDDDEDDNY